MSYKIYRPDRHTVIYEDCESKIEFEVELDSRGIALYTNSPKVLGDTEVDLTLVISKVKSWLENDFVEVILDDTPPPVFNLDN